MASTPAYLLSLLGRQLLLGEPAFRKRYPDSWLVWEASDGLVATDPDQSNEMTRLPRARFPERPASGDALCFVVAGGPDTFFDIGRGAENAIVIAEASVSRQHCRLSKQNGVWCVSRLPGAMPMSLDRKPVTPGQPVPLEGRSELILGNVILSFHSTASLIDRLRGSNGGGAKNAAGQ